MALRTNSKQAKANLWQYITDATAGYIEDLARYDNISPCNTREALAGVIWDAFKVQALENNKGYEAGRVRLYDAFEYWAQGLPCGGLFDYYLHTAINTAGDILEETETEKARFTEEQASAFLTRYIFDAIRKETGRYFL